MGTHDEQQIDSLASALDEVVAKLDSLHANGEIQATAGAVKTSPGFARFA
jgi:hypothetical protein